MESLIGDVSLAAVVSGVDLVDLERPDLIDFSLPPLADVYIGDGFIPPQPDNTREKISTVCIFILCIYQGHNASRIRNRIYLAVEIVDHVLRFVKSQFFVSGHFQCFFV